MQGYYNPCSPLDEFHPQNSTVNGTTTYGDHIHVTTDNHTTQHQNPKHYPTI